MPPRTKRQIAALLAEALTVINPDDGTIIDTVIYRDQTPKGVRMDPPLIQFTLIEYDDQDEEVVRVVTLTPLISIIEE